jgi:hypothetical protein
MSWDHFQTCTKDKENHKTTTYDATEQNHILNETNVVKKMSKKVLAPAWHGPSIKTIPVRKVWKTVPLQQKLQTTCCKVQQSIGRSFMIFLILSTGLEVISGHLLRIVCHMFGICMDFPQFYENSHDHHTDFCWQSICCSIYNNISLVLSCRSIWSFSANLVVKPFPHFVQTWGFFVNQFVSL